MIIIHTMLRWHRSGKQDQGSGKREVLMRALPSKWKWCWIFLFCMCFAWFLRCLQLLWKTALVKTLEHFLTAGNGNNVCMCFAWTLIIVCFPPSLCTTCGKLGCTTPFFACYGPLSDGIVCMWLVRNYYRTAVEKWVVGAERRQDGESYFQF